MTFDEISLAAMKESPVNPRKHFDEARLAELAESIKQRGIIAPLLVRPCGDGTYEIAAGHRRYRAAKLAGLVTVPVGIREMDDREFMEVLTVENLQREDIHPLEEAQGYQELQSHFAYDVAAIADKIGKPEAYVYGRLQLCSLIPVVQTAFLGDEITIGHARLISRLEPSEQENGLTACFQRDWTTGRDSLVSVAALKNHIRNNTGRNLERAPFDLTAALGDAIACVHCSKAAGVNPLLVDPDGDKICLDPACYQRKVTAHVEQLRTSGLVAITTNWNKGAGEGVLPPRDYEVIEAEPDQSDQDELAELRVSLETEADEQARQDLTAQIAELERHIADQVEKPCGFAEQAVVVDGYEPLGSTKTICRNPQCPVHGARLQLGTSTPAEEQRAKKEQAERLMKEKARHASRRKAMAELADTGLPLSAFREVLAKHFLDELNNAEKLREFAGLYDVATPKKGSYSDLRTPIWKAFEALPEDEQDSFVIRLFLFKFVDGYGFNADALADMAKAHGVDLKKLEAAELKALKAKAAGKEDAKSKKKGAAKSAVANKKGAHKKAQ